MMVQENLIELEKMAWSRRSKSRWSSFLFRRLRVFLFWWDTNWIKFLFNEGLFLKIKGFRILLNQRDQFLRRLIKVLQSSKGQDHLIVQIGVVL